MYFRFEISKSFMYIACIDIAYVLDVVDVPLLGH